MRNSTLHGASGRMALGTAAIATLLSTTAYTGDYELPRPTSLTATEAVIECVDPSGCSVHLACSRDSAHIFFDEDFVELRGSPISAGQILSTARKTNPRERCVVRLAADSPAASAPAADERVANVLGFRFVKMKKSHGSFHYSGMSQVPIHRAGPASRVHVSPPSDQNALATYFFSELGSTTSFSEFVESRCGPDRVGSRHRQACRDGYIAEYDFLQYIADTGYSRCVADWVKPYIRHIHHAPIELESVEEAFETGSTGLAVLKQAFGLISHGAGGSRFDWSPKVAHTPQDGDDLDRQEGARRAIAKAEECQALQPPALKLE